MRDLKVALIQTKLCWENKDANFSHLETHLKNVPSEADLIVLPEMFTTGFSMNPEMFSEKMTGKGVEWLKGVSKQKNAVVVGSLIIEEKKKYYNRLIAMKPDGSFDHYDKRHLFRLAGEEKIYSEGSKKKSIVINGWKVALFICYDLRFPVWVRSKDDADCILFIANWPEKRKDAWISLLKARAIENQAFVLGVNRVGKDGNGFSHSGDSSIYGPLGECLDHRSNEECIILHCLKKEHLLKTRESFPFYKDADRFKLL